MELKGLHLLLTYQCTFECEHCFVWGSPFQSGVFTLAQINNILDQAEACGTINSIYFEGGEPFLYHPVLVKAVEAAWQRGFSVGIVSNAYWATSIEDAIEWLRPLAGKIADLSVSSDLFHYSEAVSRQSLAAAAAANQLGIPTGVISVAQPENGGELVVGQLPESESGVMYRGRAAVKLADKAPHHPYQTFTTCPYEDLVDPGRVHVDPLGNVHLCQGIVIGNLFEKPLMEICQEYNPQAHPIVGPLLRGGPLELAGVTGFEPIEAYADACHFCYEMRVELRERFPEELAPGQVYGV